MSAHKSTTIADVDSLDDDDSHADNSSAAMHQHRFNFSFWSGKIFLSTLTQNAHDHDDVSSCSNSYNADVSSVNENSSSWRFFFIVTDSSS